MPQFVPAIIALATAGTAYATAGAIASFVLSVAISSFEAASARRKARDAYNASLQDRLVTVATTDKARSRCYGLVRNTDGVLFKATSGEFSQYYTIVTAHAGHEIDGFEAFYFNDEELILDSDGWVIGSLRTENFHIQSASATFTTKTALDRLSVSAYATYGATVTPLTISSVTDTTVTVAGASPSLGGTVTIKYRPSPSPWVAEELVTLQIQRVNVTGVVTVALSDFPQGVVRVSMSSGETGGDRTAGTGVASVTGLSASFDVGAATWETVTFLYQVVKRTSKARIWKYNGAAGQDVSGLLSTLAPGLITAAHRFAGIALTVTRLEYDTDVYTGGPPSITARFRGAKVLDPRTGTTAYTRNLALISRDWALFVNGGNCETDDIDEVWFAAAANACDIAQAFTIADGTYPGGVPTTTPGEFTLTMPLYAGGIVCPLDQDPYALFGAMVQGMGGKFGWSQGRLRVRAGVYMAPELTIDEDWLSGVETIDIVPEPAIADSVNVYTATIADQAEKFVPVPTPAVRAQAYIDNDGCELPRDIQLSAVNDIYRAQHICGVLMRDERNGMTLKVPCNLHALQVGLLEVHRLTLPRFGIYDKPVEVADWQFSLTGGPVLTLKETGANIFDPAAKFEHADATPNTALPEPWKVEQILGLAAESVVTTAADGSFVTRTRVTWSPATGANVTQSGSIQIQWTRADQALPAGDWPGQSEAGSAIETIVVGLRDNTNYLFRARAVSALARGLWSEQVLHHVTALPTIEYTDLVGRPKVFRVVSRGYIDTAAPVAVGLYDGETNTLINGSALPYQLAVISRSTGAVIYTGSYSPLVNGLTAANQLAADLNALNSSQIAVIWTNDEPSTNRLLGNLPAAMKRCGATSAVWGNPNFAYRSAYVLIGIPDCGEGNGIESYKGDDPTKAFCDVTFALQAGNLITAANAAAAVAAAAAAAASQASANAALAELSDIASDSLLTPVEKPVVVRDYSVIATEQAGIDSQASNYGVVAEKATYDSAVAALTTYLASLTTPTQWDDLSGNTSLVGSTFRSKFIAVYVARQAVLDKIAAIAKARTPTVTVNTPSGVGAVTVTEVSFTPDGFSHNTLVASVSVTPLFSGAAQVFFEGRGRYTNSAGFLANAQFSLQLVGGTYDAWKKVDNAFPVGSTNVPFQMHTTRSFAVAAGTAYTFGLYAHKLSDDDTFVVDNIEMRAELVSSN